MKKSFKLIAIAFGMFAIASCSSKSSTTDSAAENQDSTSMENVEPQMGDPRDINSNDIIAMKIDRLEKELELTNEQKQKVIELFTTSVTKIDSTVESNDGERPDRETIRETIENEVEKMKEILSQEQFEKYQKMMERGPRPGGPRPE